jgi:8-oxo-dGTP pyrophosphatase MutT (NUDIX family)
MWSTDKDIVDLFYMMTPAEKERLLKFSFESLWNDMWVCKELDVWRYGRESARRKFELINPKIKMFVDKTRMSSYTTLPWGFPKGKTNTNELAQECALREFKEELNWYRSRRVNEAIDYNDIVLWNNGPILESFYGSDGRLYETYYYIAETKTELPFISFKDEYSIRGETLSEEAMAYAWVTPSDAKEKLSAMHVSLLEKVIEMVM